jgi:hypothetical protein
MTEATLKRAFVQVLKAIMPGCVVYRHEDKFRGGVPDISLTYAGVTSWIEVKYSRPGRTSRPSPLQRLELTRLRDAGAPTFLLEYTDAWVHLYPWGSGVCMEPHTWERKGGGHEQVARYLHAAHVFRI